MSSSDPVDLTVDWIHDQLYWVDSALCEIHEFNIVTNATRFILSTGTSETSFPRGIVIYPYKNNGWLYWTDQTGGSLEMGSINSGNRESLITGLPCVQALTIDYPSHTVYWADICRYSFQSLSLNGDRETFSYPFSQLHEVYFVSSMGKFNDNLFWVQPIGIFMVESSGDGYRVVMNASSTQRPLAMQVVHPSQQPPDDEYLDIILNPGDTEIVCNPPCNEQLGVCIPPGLCACTKGWAGSTCNEDIDECEIETDECEQICTNYAGGYNCSCYSGYSLSNNSKSCTDIDECAMNSDGCEQDCSNIPGGYYCSCASGYSMNSNLHTCSDVDECAGGSDDCHQICSNHDGGFLCSCEQGYLLSDDMKTCTWIEVETNLTTTTVIGSNTVTSALISQPGSRAPTYTAASSGVLQPTYLASSSVLLQLPTLPSSTHMLGSDVSTLLLSSGKSTFRPTISPLATVALSTAVYSASIDTSVTIYPSVSPTKHHIEQSSQVPSTLGVHAPLTSRENTQTITSTLPPVPTSVPTSYSSQSIGVSTNSYVEIYSVTATSATATSATAELYVPSVTYSSTISGASTTVPIATGIKTVDPTTTLVYSTMYSATKPSALEPSVSNIVSSTIATQRGSITSHRPLSIVQSGSSVPLTTVSSTTEEDSSVAPVTLPLPERSSATVTQRTTSTEVQTTEHHEPTSLTTAHPTTISYTATQLTFSGAATTTSGYESSTSAPITNSRHIFPSVGLTQASKGTQWHTKNILALVIVAIGVVPALAALVVLVSVRWHRRCHDRGSWSPNHNITDVVVEEPVPHIDDGHVSMSSSRSLHEEK
jgi:hypothetical protein